MPPAFLLNTMTIQRCPVCNVAWYEGEAPKHVMDCSARALCEHEWDFKTDCCVKCGATWQDVVDKELRHK